MIASPLRAVIELVRRPRGRCPLCGRRRVLYGIAVRSEAQEIEGVVSMTLVTAARCATCSGVR